MIFRPALTGLIALLLLFGVSTSVQPANTASAALSFSIASPNQPPPSNCPANDGSGSPAAGAAQYPNLLNGYSAANTITSLGCKAAGVGYAVGCVISGNPCVSGSAGLTDWESISVSGVSVNVGNSEVSIDSGSPTLSNIDFSLHGGAYISISSNATGLTVTNSFFGCNSLNASGPAFTLIYNPSSIQNVRLTYNNADWYNCEGVSGPPFQANIFEYNWLRNTSATITTGGQILEGPAAGNLTYKYNLIDDIYPCGGDVCHENYIQWDVFNGTSDVEFNTTIQKRPNGAEGFQFYGNSGGTAVSVNLSYNTMIALQNSGSDTMSYIDHCGGNLSGTGTIKGNYFDISGASGAFYPSTCTSSFGYTIASGNINMVSGATITP